MAKRVLTHTIRAEKNAEVWTNAAGSWRKVTVRVAKGQPGGGQFHGATNLRGTVLAPQVSLVKGGRKTA